MRGEDKQEKKIRADLREGEGGGEEWIWGEKGGRRGEGTSMG